MSTQIQQDKFIYLPVYLSDYVSQSRKLTMLQRGAFIDLSVLYFQENLKLNYSKEQIYRMVFAFEKEEKEAVDFILDNYFTKSENKPTGFYWVSNQLNDIGDKVLKKLKASRENGKKGGRGKKSENKPTGSNLLNPEKTILNESKLNETKLNKNENNNKINSELINHNHKSELDLFCDEIVISLQEILSRKLNRNITTSNWNKEIKLIVNSDLKIRGEQQARQDLIKCIQAVENHYGKEYFPIIQSAKSLREKFIKIENYLERSPQAKKDKLDEEFLAMSRNNKGEF
jgi:uncharacterized protein YdaU (DUF1376 family)